MGKCFLCFLGELKTLQFPFDLYSRAKLISQMLYKIWFEITIPLKIPSLSVETNIWCWNIYFWKRNGFCWFQCGPKSFSHIYVRNFTTRTNLNKEPFYTTPLLLSSYLCTWLNGPKCINLSPTCERVPAWTFKSYTLLVVRLFKYIWKGEGK